MTLQLQGNYLSRLKFGDTNVVLEPNGVNEFYVIQDMSRFLPSFRLNFKDPGGIFTHVMPFDKNMSRVTFQLGVGVAALAYNFFNFLAYRKDSESGYDASGDYGISGLLNVSNLFSPNYCRAWKQNISEVLTQIALEELKVDKVEISPSLEYSKLVLQPYWSNAQLLNYLTANLIGRSGEGAYYCFIKVEQGLSIFVFKSLNDFVGREIKYKFVVGDDTYGDNFPIFDYSIMDNYMLYGALGSRTEGYGYYDYKNGNFVSEEEGLQSFPAISQFHLIDREDLDYKHVQVDLGRSNEFTSDFKGRVLSSYYKGIANLSKMWILTWGLGDVSPGDMVRVLFLPEGDAGALFSYQYSGFWLVERVVHSFGDTFKTRLLLTRNGVDSDRETSLESASNFKRV